MTVRPQSAQRMTSLMLVMLMHGLLLMLLLHAFTQKNARPNTARETILQLLPMFQRTPQQDAAPSSGAAENARPVAAPVVPPVTATQPAAPDVTGLGMRLFGCAPEQLAALSPAERARCVTGLAHPDRSVVTIPKSHVQDPARPRRRDEGEECAGAHSLHLCRGGAGASLLHHADGDDRPVLHPGRIAERLCVPDRRAPVRNFFLGCPVIAHYPGKFPRRGKPIH